MSKTIQNLLEKVLQEVQFLKEQVEYIKKDIGIIKEESHRTSRQVHDLNVKKDIELVENNLKKSVTKKKKSTISSASSKPKKPMNIMAYFKTKYREDPEVIYEIVSKDEIDALLKENESLLKNKKKANLESAIITIIYKELFSNKNKKNQTLLRTKKDLEEEKEMVKQKEIVECDVGEEYDDEEDYENVREDNLIDDDADEYESGDSD